jgi:hypothetical protein
MTTFAQDKWTQNPSNRKPFDPLGQGRWPANLIVGGEEVVEGFPEVHGAGVARKKDVLSEYDASSYHASKVRQMNRFGDSGSASRFFFNFLEQESDE